MNDARYYRYAPLLVAGPLAVAVIWAMFSEPRRSAPDGSRPAGMGERAGALWLGADLAPGDPSVPPGGQNVRVTRVWSRSPARAAGLAAGDVILQFDGRPVSTPSEVEAVLSDPRSPQDMDLVIRRGRQVSLVRVTFQNRPEFAMNIGMILLVLAAVFAVLYLTALDRVAVVGCGAVLSVLLGIALGFYDQQGAFSAIRMSTLALLLGMGLITVALEETGFFATVAERVGKASRGDWSRLMVLLCVITFLLSSFMNNLTTILVILPVTLSLARELRLDPTPLVIAEIISSNLGGASSMIGDFPNMLIASATGRHFHDFLLYMAPPCLIQLAIVIWFMKRKKSGTRIGRHATQQDAAAGSAVSDANTARMTRNTDRDTEASALAPEKRRQALAVLSAVIVAFLLCGTFDLPPATVALAGGFTVLLLWNRAAPRLIGKAGLGDILFFSGLFVLVGCAEASGLLDFITSWIMEVSGGGVLWLALILMWAAAVVTTFLSAGPTTAIFVPIVLGLGISEPHGLFWWALSLGVCAGSSATITGATAGPVALTKVEEFLKRTKPGAGPAPIAELSFASYAKVGVPLMFVFLLVSSAYIWGLSAWS